MIAYLASPYTHENKSIEQERFRLACQAVMEIEKANGYEFTVFSPIVHYHWIARYGDLPGDYFYWKQTNRSYLEKCERLIVLCIDGWRESIGVRAEIKMAQEMGIPIRYERSNVGQDVDQLTSGAITETGRMATEDDRAAD